MTVNNFVTAEELARQRSFPILGVADSKIFRRGHHDQTTEIWSSDGALLAPTHQVVYDWDQICSMRLQFLERRDPCSEFRPCRLCLKLMR